MSLVTTATRKGASSSAQLRSSSADCQLLDKHVVKCISPLCSSEDDGTSRKSKYPPEIRHRLLPRIRTARFLPTPTRNPPHCPCRLPDPKPSQRRSLELPRPLPLELGYLSHDLGGPTLPMDRLCRGPDPPHSSTS